MVPVLVRVRCPTMGLFGSESLFVVKGVHDIATGLVLFALVLARQRAAVPVVMAIFTLIPIGDAVNVIAHLGDLATALGYTCSPQH